MNSSLKGHEFDNNFVGTREQNSLNFIFKNRNLLDIDEPHFSDPSKIDSLTSRKT
jgi:hypothetical protein